MKDFFWGMAEQIAWVLLFLGVVTLFCACGDIQETHGGFFVFLAGYGALKASLKPKALP